MVAHLPPWQESLNRSETVGRRKTLLHKDFGEIIAIQGRIRRASDRTSSTREHAPLLPRGACSCTTPRLRNRPMVFTEALGCNTLLKAGQSRLSAKR
jgi:hypothetical protein